MSLSFLPHTALKILARAKALSVGIPTLRVQKLTLFHALSEIKNPTSNLRRLLFAKSLTWRSQYHKGLKNYIN